MERVVLITGANSGIGFALAGQLLAKGSYHVLLGARSRERGETALATLKAGHHSGRIDLVQLDVTDEGSIASAVRQVKEGFGRLDVLVNNAAVVPISPPLREQLRQSFETNATGPAVVTEAFSPLLAESQGTARIVNVSSGAGSIARTLDVNAASKAPLAMQYRSSKAALNMITAVQWLQYGPAVKVFAYCPGFTQSNLSDLNKKENGAKDADVAVVSLVDIIEGKRDEEAGGFLHVDGTYPW